MKAARGSSTSPVTGGSNKFKYIFIQIFCKSKYFQNILIAAAAAVEVED